MAFLNKFTVGSPIAFGSIDSGRQKNLFKFAKQSQRFAMVLPASGLVDSQARTAESGDFFALDAGGVRLPGSRGRLLAANTLGLSAGVRSRMGLHSPSTSRGHG